MALRRQQTSLRTVEAHHRALDTMGRLAAQQAGGEPRPAKPVDPDHPYVRVVRDEAPPAGPPKPPSLRSRSRRSRPPTPPAKPAQAADAAAADVTVSRPAAPVPTPLAEPPVPGPNTRIVAAGDHRSDPAFMAAEPTPASGVDVVAAEPPAPPSVPVSPPADREVLRFDASGDYAAPAAARSDALAGDAGRGAPTRPRTTRARTRRRRARFGGAGRRPALTWRTAAAFGAVIVVLAGIAAAVVALDNGTHGKPSKPPAQAAPAHPAVPPASATTTPTTAASPADLVASSAGSSTYRVGPSATIAFQAVRSACWMEIRQSGPTGPVLFAGDITSGQSRVINGPAWVRLGNPGVIQVTVDGAALSPPGMSLGQPYDLQFA